MAAKGFVLGRVFGIEVRASRSWSIICLLVTVSLALHFTQAAEGWSGVAVFGAALAASLLLFVSVLFHEVAHCVVARRFGIPARSVTLNFFGGFSALGREASRPIEELAVSVAGPLVNAAFAVIFFAVEWLAEGRSDMVSQVSGLLARLNVVLTAFNLAPGLPLDGGRVLRAVVWWLTGSYERATRVAAFGGVAVAGLLMMAGLALVLTGAFDGLWVALVGFYLYSRARASRFELVLRSALNGLTVASMWLHTLPQVGRSTTLEGFAQELSPIGEEATDPHFMVVDEGIIWGVVAASHLARVDRGRWKATTVGDIMTPIGSLQQLSFRTDIMRALEAMNSSDVGELPVVENNTIQGFVGRDSLLRFVSSRIASENG
jgi:Zn-dependent protease